MKRDVTPAEGGVLAEINLKEVVYILLKGPDEFTLPAIQTIHIDDELPTVSVTKPKSTVGSIIKCVARPRNKLRKEFVPHYLNSPISLLNGRTTNTDSPTID
jgi:hypothetical protein